MLDCLLPGIFGPSVTFRASNAAVGLSEDLRRNRSFPLDADGALGGPAGRTTADLVRNVLIGLIIVVGYLVASAFRRASSRRSHVSALVAAFGFALSWIFAFVALVVRGAETAEHQVAAAVSAGLRGAWSSSRSRACRAGCSRSPKPRQSSDSEQRRAPSRSSAVCRGVRGALGWIVGIVALFVPLSVSRYRRMS